MPPSVPKPEANAPPPDDTPYVRALAAGSLDPLVDDPAVALLVQMRDRVQTDDVSLEIAALHLLLYRLLIEHHDLPSLVPLVTRMVSAATQAARVRQAISGKGAEDLLAAVATIVDELAGRT